MKIYILDLEPLVKERGHPGCHAEDLVEVHAETGVVYLSAKDGDSMSKVPPGATVHHRFGTHAAPYLFSQVSTSYYCCKLKHEASLFGLMHSVR